MPAAPGGGWPSRLAHACSRVIEVMTIAAIWIAGAVLVLLMLLTVADVLAQELINEPITGVFDFTHFAVLSMVFLGFAYCGFRGDHVSIELVYGRLGPRVQSVLDRLTSLIGAGLFSLIAWRALVQADLVRELEEASNMLEIPFYPFYWLLAFGSALFALVMLLRVFVRQPPQAASPEPLA